MKALSSNGKAHRCRRWNSGSIPDNAYLFLLTFSLNLNSSIKLQISHFKFQVSTLKSQIINCQSFLPFLFISSPLLSAPFVFIFIFISNSLSFFQISSIFNLWIHHTFQISNQFPRINSLKSNQIGSTPLKSNQIKLKHIYSNPIHSNSSNNINV